MNFSILSFFLLVSCLFSQHINSSPTLVRKGAMSLEGSLSLPIVSEKNQGTRVGLHIAPSFSYFLAKGLSFDLGVNIVNGWIGQDSAPWGLGFEGGAKYHLTFTSALYPYVGAHFALVSWPRGKMTDYILKFPIGILVPLNRHIALDLGSPIEIYFTNDGYSKTVFNIGFLGVRGFF